MRKAMAIVRLYKSVYTYRVEYFKIVTKDFQDIDFTSLVNNREYFTLYTLCSEIIRLAEANGFKIEVTGEGCKIPNILLDTGTGTLLKYVFARDSN